MKRYAFIIILIIISASIHANDGGVAIVGGEIYPVNITNVSMEYERLNITCKEKYFEIEVYIELFSHEKNVITPLLGFEFAEGMHFSEENIEKFKEYILLVNSEPQKFEYGKQQNGLPTIHT